MNIQSLLFQFTAVHWQEAVADSEPAAAEQGSEPAAAAEQVEEPIAVEVQVASPKAQVGDAPEAAPAEAAPAEDAPIGEVAPAEEQSVPAPQSPKRSVAATVAAADLQAKLAAANRFPISCANQISDLFCDPGVLKSSRRTPNVRIKKLSSNGSARHLRRICDPLWKISCLNKRKLSGRHVPHTSEG